LATFTTLNSLRVALLLTAATYFLYFVPMCWIFAEDAGVDFLSTLLFLEIPRDLLAGHIREPTGQLTSAASSYMSSLGVAYGAISLGCFALTFQIKGYGLVRAITSLNGFILGYIFTLYFARYALHITDVFENGNDSIAKIFYTYLLYLCITPIKENLKFNKPWRPQYDAIYDGIFATVSAGLLFFGYPEKFSTILLGPAFFIFSVIGMVISEFTTTKVFLALMRATAIFSSERFAAWTDYIESLPMSGSRITNMKIETFFATIFKSWRLPIRRLAGFYRRGMARVMRQEPGFSLDLATPTGHLTINLGTTVGVWLFFSIFPWIPIGFLALLERHLAQQ
jgi:hypothetical protein